MHQPYPLCRGELTAWDEQLLTLNGFSPTGRPPDHIIKSRGVDVTVFPLERVNARPLPDQVSALSSARLHPY